MKIILNPTIFTGFCSKNLLRLLACGIVILLVGIFYWKIYFSWKLVSLVLLNIYKDSIMQDLQTWIKTTPILALVGVLVLQLSQGQFCFSYKTSKERTACDKCYFAFISNFWQFIHGLWVLLSVEILLSLKAQKMNVV